MAGKKLGFVLCIHQITTKKIFIITFLNTTGKKLPADGGSSDCLAAFRASLHISSTSNLFLIFFKNLVSLPEEYR